MNGVMLTMVLMTETRAMMRTSVIRNGRVWPHLVHHQRCNVAPREIVEANPESCDSETKSVEGDDGQDSVWSSIHPPASS